MPSPTAHIYYAGEYIKRHGRVDSGAFLRGTIFPDIRYIANIDRSLTHRRDVGMDEIAREADDWKAGVLLHCWVDEAWAGFFSQFGLDPEDHSLDSTRAALKLLEDEQLHVLLSRIDVAKVASAIEAGGEGGDYGVSPVAITLWNRLVADLVRAKDTKTSRELLMSAMHIGHSAVLALEHREHQLRSDSAWGERVRDCRRLVTEIF